MIKLLAFDLDGTLTQHKSQLSNEHREILLALKEKYTLIMVGAGDYARIFKQMGDFPIDIIGNYGMQYAKYDSKTKTINISKNEVANCDKKACEEKITYLRNKFGFTTYAGESVEFHASGCVTFPILGTKAKLEDKLAFDPDRSKRRAIYNEVASLFADYNVFVGGSSSFDMSPKPFNKYYALDLYCQENGIKHNEVCFFGDDYGIGGNDESVYKSDFNFIKIDNYLDFPSKVKELDKFND